jgi:hypothetical protein
MYTVLRSLISKDVLVSENGVQKTIHRNQLGSSFKVDGFIRFNTGDFSALPRTKGSVIAHFNLQVSNHKIGSIYGLVQILQSGWFKHSTGEEQLPLLSIDEVIIAEVIDAREHLDYGDIKDSIFEHSLRSIKSVDSLKASIWKRYHASMPELAHNEMMNLGAAFTLLKIV